MRATVAIVTLLAVLLGLRIGYSTAGLGGALAWGALLGFGGLLIGRSVVSTASLVARAWRVAVGLALFVFAAVMTWGVRFSS